MIAFIRKHWLEILLLLLIGTLGVVFRNYYNREQVASEVSQPPGCRTANTNTFSGCFAKTIVRDLSIVPRPSCIVVEEENCSGYALFVRNKCEDNFILGNITIGPGQSATLDVRSEGQDSKLVRSEAPIIPMETRVYEFRGSVGSQSIIIRFEKTKAFCD